MGDTHGESPPSKGRSNNETDGLPRRRFLQTSAAAVAVAGLGLSGSAAAQTGSVPGYADFVPDDDRLVLNNGAIRFSSLRLEAYFELLATVQNNEQQNNGQETETTPFQFEPQALSIFGSISAFALYGELNIEEQIIGAALSQTQEQVNPEEFPDDSPTDQVLAISLPRTENQVASFGAQISIGSYDADSIATAVEESGFTESDTDGIFVGSDPRIGGTQTDAEVAIAWSSEYVISARSVDLVGTIEAAAQGQSPRLYEQNDTVARQLSGAGGGDFQTTYISRSGELQLSQADQAFNIDYSPVQDAQIQGYTGSFSYDIETGTASAITVFSHPSAGAVDQSAFSSVGTSEGAANRNLSISGRFVTIETSYEVPNLDGDDGSDGGDDGSDSGSDDGGDGSDSGSDDGTDGSDSGSDDSGDGSNGDSDDGDMDNNDSSGDGDGGSDSNDDTDSESDDSESSDDSGPGFGILSAVTGLGGAGYILKRRLEHDDLE